MVYCDVCENEFPEEEMRQVIFKEGITNVCNECYRDDMPLFEKPDMEKLRGIYSRRSVYKRLSESAGVKDVESHKQRVSEFGKNSDSMSDESLRRVANRSYDEKLKQAPKNEDLIDNFHWIIMRARRSKKISQKQLSEEIQEPEASIAMAERGVINPNNIHLVRKLEEFLRIKISKKSIERAKMDASYGEHVKKELLEKLKSGGEMDDLTVKTLVIEDLDVEPKKKKWWQFGKRKEKKEEEEKDSVVEVVEEE